MIPLMLRLLRTRAITFASTGLIACALLLASVGPAVHAMAVAAPGNGASAHHEHLLTDVAPCHRTAHGAVHHDASPVDVGQADEPAAPASDNVDACMPCCTVMILPQQIKVGMRAPTTARHGVGLAAAAFGLDPGAPQKPPRVADIAALTA